MTSDKNTNPQIEDNVLITLLHEPNSRIFLSQILPGCFTQDRKELFKAIYETSLKGDPVTIDYLAVKYNGKLSPLDLAIKYSDISRRLDRNTFKWSIDYLKDLYFSRMALAMSYKIARASENQDNDLCVKLSQSLVKAHAAIYKQSRDSTNCFSVAVDDINSPAESIPTCIDKLNSIMSGWTRGAVSSMGAKSGHHKTTFTVFDTTESIKRGYIKKAMYFTVDEPAEKVARRIIANDMDLSLTAMREKKIVLSKDEIVKAMSTLYKDRLAIIDDLFSIEKIIPAILDVKPDRVIIDYIQDLNFGEDGLSDQKITITTQRLKEAAKAVNCNITILSQVRDKVVDERFDDKIPRPHDFLYASDLRRNSREQVVGYWTYKDQMSKKELMSHYTIIVWKSTYSDTGTVSLLVDPDKARFSNVTKQTKTNPDDIWSKF